MKGWKKVYVGAHQYLVLLEVDEKTYLCPKFLFDNRIVENTELKCRCPKAKVVGIWKIIRVKGRLRATFTLRQQVTNCRYNTTYRVGRYVYPDKFSISDCACDHGIHFFLTKKQALEY